jgi:hypothetical protein
MPGISSADLVSLCYVEVSCINRFVVVILVLMTDYFAAA